MLTQLYIRQFAIVDELTIEFTHGMSAITGETGAGKSIALDALSLCLGARAEAGMVRADAEKAEIAAEFSLTTLPTVLAWLEERELDAGQECILRRTISAEGRSKAFINGAPVPVALLKEIGTLLVCLHGQHDHHQLLKPEQQLALLDQYGGHGEQLSKTATAWRALQTLRKEKNNLQAEHDQHQSRRQLIDYQVRELDEFALAEGEFDQLETDYKRLANSQALKDDASYSLNSLYDGEHNNAYSLVESVAERLRANIELDPALSPIVDLLDEASVRIEEAVHELRHYHENMEGDPETLQINEERISTALQLARKHHVAAAELPALQQQLHQELASLDHATDRLDELTALIDDAQTSYQSMANSLSEARQKTAKQLAQRIMETMHQLNMPDGSFHIEVVQLGLTHATAQGFDAVSFDVSVNAGQRPQALQKVASGGELSRISLAIQVLTAQREGLPTLIFDEVDVGVSGPTAATVGKLMRQLGEKNQVICVTHLPQVAARAHHQLQVTKHTRDGQTYTGMQTLNADERVMALAQLLGGDSVTQNTIANAEELLAG